MTNRRSALESALDVVLYAPIGLAVEVQRIVPELAREGRTRLDQRVTLARFVGRHAVRVGRRAVEQRLSALRTSSLLPVRGGVAPDPRPTPSAVIDTSSVGPTTTAPPAGAGEAHDLAIPGYDSLSASQVVGRLGALSVEELAAIAEYEGSHRRRRTILGKIDQLRSRVA